MVTGNLGKWRKQEGQELIPGDVIAEVETDKVRKGGTAPGEESGAVFRLSPPPSPAPLPPDAGHRGL
jgi:hypothetical protein